jgi:hypothetical protein
MWLLVVQRNLAGQGLGTPDLEFCFIKRRRTIRNVSTIRLRIQNNKYIGHEIKIYPTLQTLPFVVKAARSALQLDILLFIEEHSQRLPDQI